MEVGVFEPRARSTNRIACSVYGCDSKSHKNLDLIFHGLPKKNARFVYIKSIFGEMEKIDQLKAWKNALRMDKKLNKYSYVCSLHFRKEDYILPYAASQKRRLKTTAVPSCNLPRSSIETSKKNVKLNIAREERHLKRASQQEEVINTAAIDPAGDETILIDVLEDMDHESNNDSCDKSETTAVPRLEPQINLSHDIGIQVNSDFILPKFTEFIKTDTQLYTATGIESIDVLETIVDIAKTICNDNFNRSGGRLSLRDKIVMVFVKLKQNISYAFLGILFNGYTVKHCQRIFYETLSMLSQCLSVAVCWRSKEEIARNIPNCFQGLEDVRVILECTKIIVQRSKELSSKDSTSVHDGSSDTYKIYTGLTPAGNFSFISKPFSSNITDDDIFQQSNILSLLEPGDAVMIDKGSQYINKLCEINNCKCIRPLFLKNKKQTESSVLLTEKILKARLHIKRSNQRIKTFKIINDKMPVNLIPRVHEIFTVICATLNLFSSNIKDKEYIVIEQLNDSNIS